MSKIQITGPSTGTGTLTITSTATNTDQTITFPNTTATVVAVDPGTASNVLTSNGSAWVSQAISAGGDYIMTAYTTPATWTKPAGLKAVKVTVIGAGGNGGSGTSAITYGGNGGGGGGAILYADAPAVPGPITVTVGTAPSKTSSFGPLVSATGGTNGTNATPGVNAPFGPYAGGAGSSGTVNFTGQDGIGAADATTGGHGGASALFFGPSKVPVISGPFVRAGVVYGGGGCGGWSTNPGGAGGAGIVIVEEFY
jgi:hypothetical protein